MKRIFLTSGLVLCLACPAFADLTAPIENHTDGIVSGTESNPVDPSCQYPTLEGYTGTSTFTAIWNPIWHTITLNENDYNASNNTTGLGDSTYNASPSPLYSVQGDANVYQAISGAAGSEELSSPIAANGTVLSTSLPRGRTVNYALDANVPSGAGTATLPTVTGQEMTFKGFYDSASGSTQYITAAGVLTSDGSSAAASATTDSTWYAQYNCATPTWTGGADNESTSEIIEHLPTLAGYNFLGWTTTNSSSDTNYVTPGCISEDTTLYAQWEAAEFTVSFDCGRPVANATIPGTNNTYAVSASESTSSNPASRTIAMNGNIAITESCTLNGWRFDGWNCTAGLTSDAAGASAVTDILATNLASPGYTVYLNTATNVTCTAKWTPNDIDLVWDVDGGSFASGESATFTGTGSGTSCSYDGGIQIPTTPTKTGYEFGGWQVDNQ